MKSNPFEEIVAREQRLCEDRGDAFTRWFGLPVSLVITRGFVRFGLSENLATFLMWSVGVAGAVVMCFGAAGILAGSLLLIAHHVLDYVDGQLARQRGTASLVGAVRDRWSHYTVEMLSFAGLAAGLYREFASVWVFAAVAVFVFWNRFRIFIDTLAPAILCNELTRYPVLERDIMLRNYRHSGPGEAAVADPAASPAGTGAAPAPRSAWLELRSQLRVTSTSFNWLTVMLAGAALLQLLFAPLPLLYWGVLAIAAYYLLNIVDYSLTYLFSDRILADVARVEGPVRSAFRREAENGDEPS